MTPHFLFIVSINSFIHIKKNDIIINIYNIDIIIIFVNKYYIKEKCKRKDGAKI